MQQCSGKDFWCHITNFSFVSRKVSCCHDARNFDQNRVPLSMCAFEYQISSHDKFEYSKEKKLCNNAQGKTLGAI